MNLTPTKHNLFVEMNDEFNSTITFKDGSQIYLDTSFEHYRHVRQNGKVYAVSPKVKGVKVGDTVWFHHFVPVTETIKGYTVSTHNEYLRKLIGKRLYLVDAKDRNIGGAEQLFLYENESGIHTYGETVMIRPIRLEIPKTESGIFLESNEKDAVQEGIIAYTNESLEKFGFNVGDRVKFSKHSEYELDVNGELLWRMNTTDIYLKYEEG